MPETSHLFVYGVSLAKDGPSTNETREKGIKLSLFTAGERFLDEQCGLVDCDEARQVQRVLLGRAIDVRQPLADTVGHFVSAKTGFNLQRRKRSFHEQRGREHTCRTERSKT